MTIQPNLEEMRRLNGLRGPRFNMKYFHLIANRKHIKRKKSAREGQGNHSGIR
jgi:hypothetical protein